MLLFYCLFLSIISSYYGVHSQVSNITLLNSTNAFCEQDIVQFNCTVTGSMTDYQDSRAGLSINGSSCTSTPFDVNVNEPRVNFTIFGANSAAPPGLYTVSPYLVQDNATQYRCCAQITTEYQYTENLVLLLAVPPYPANLSMSTTYDSAASCNGTITLTWPADTSARAVTSYEVLLNGTNIATLSPTAGYNNYTIASMSLAEFNARYTVRAISCAGSSVSNEVVFTPTPPYPANVSISTTYDSAASCNGNITLTWLAVASDRAVTSYEVLLNGTNITTLSPTAGTNSYTTSSMSLATFNGRYTVRSVSCAGSSVSNEVVFTPPTSPSQPTITTISSAYDSDTSCTGNITLTWPAVASDRAVTSYEVLLNGTVDGTITGTNSYTTASMSLAEFNGRYTVRAVSCAGSSVSNEVVFTPPNPPDSFTFAPVITCFPNNSVELNISLPTVMSDRAITQYNMYFNNKLEDTSVATGSNYEFSEILQVTQSNHNVTVIAYSCAGSTSFSATETVNCFVADVTTIIVVVVIAVGTFCFISLIILALTLLICCGCYFIRKGNTNV